MTEAFANGRTIIHKGDGGVQTCPVPDTCKTPAPSGPTPLPYVNVAQSSDLADGTTTVKIAGKSVAIEGSNLSTSTGDEAGSAGGLVSGKIKGKMKWAAGSADVLFEGKGVVRFLDVCLHNGNTDNTGGQPNTGAPGLEYGGDAPCEICKAPSGHPLPSDAETEAEIARLHATEPPTRPGDRFGYMIGVLKCWDPKNKVFVLMAAHSGPPTGGSIPNYQNPGGKGISFGGGRYNVERAGSSRLGNCAAPKLIHQARLRRLIPMAMTESWHGPPPPSGAPYRHGEHARSCATCQRLLPSMLCPVQQEKPHE